MFKKKLIVLAVVLSLTSPSLSLGAESESDKIEKQQLSALIDYMKHLLYPIRVVPMTNEDLKNAILGGVKWTMKAEESNGHFRYEYEPYEGKYGNDDNTVRQAGTLFALSEVYKRMDKEDNELKSKVEKSIEFLASITTYEEDGIACVVDIKKAGRCQLGATSLVFIGLLNYLDREPAAATKYQKLIDGYSQFILSSQKESGGFSNEYRIGLDFGQKESSFSNGEALLALARFYLYQPDDEVKQAISRAYDYLEGTEFDTALYLWIMAALKDMKEFFPVNDYHIYASEFTAWRMDSIYGRYTDKNYCAYSEGLASAYSVLSGKVSESELKIIKDELSWWNAHNFELQLSESDLYKVVKGDEKLTLNKLIEPELALGGFLTGWSEPTQRIDFTQHCISSYLQTLLDVDGGRI